MKTMRSAIVGASCVVAVAIAGCSQQRPDGPRLTTTLLKGTVYVDGEPAAKLIVKCHPEADTSELQSPLIATTDDEGNFSFGMYESGGGVPEGTYKLAFIWMTSGEKRRDQLQGAYADPEKSDFTATVVDGEPHDLGVIELSTTP